MNIQSSLHTVQRLFQFLVIFSMSLTSALSWMSRGEAALLVSSLESGDVLGFDETSGKFLGTFAEGLPGDTPISMTLGPDSNLYVGIRSAGDSSGDVIRRFNGTTGAFIDTFASGSGVSLTTGMTFGPDDNLYVTDFGNDRVVRFDGTTGALIDNFVAVGSGGINGPTGLTFGLDGNLYVSSRGTNQVLRYDGTTGAFIDTFATGGNNGPQQLLFGPDQNLYLAVDGAGGGGQVLKFDGLSGTLIDVFARNIPSTTDGMSLAFGPDRNLYVTSQFRNSVLRFDGTSGAFIDTFVSSGSGELSFPTNLLFAPGAVVPEPIPEPSEVLGTLALGALGTCYSVFQVYEVQ